MKTLEFEWDLNITKEEMLNYRTSEKYGLFFTEGIGNVYIDEFQIISNECICGNDEWELTCCISKKNLIGKFVPKFILRMVPQKWIDVCTQVLEKTRYNKKGDDDGCIGWRICPLDPDYDGKLFEFNGEMRILAEIEESIKIKNQILFDVIVDKKWIPKKVIEKIEYTILKNAEKEMTDIYKKLEEYIISQRK